MKTMSVIGIVLFSLSLFLMTMFIDEDNEAAIGWGLIATLYALAFAIVVLVKSNSKPKPVVEFSAGTPPAIPESMRPKTNMPITDMADQLLKLNELKEKGILSEDEFQAKKSDILKK